MAHLRHFPPVPIAFVTALVLCVSAAAQPPVQLPGDSVVSEWSRIGKTRMYDMSSLYQAVEGGSDQYLEFGLDSLVVQRYSLGSKVLKLELFTMVSPLSALGLYLRKSGPETPVPDLAFRHTLDSSGLMAVKGRYVLRIVPSYPHDSSTAAMAPMARIVFDQIPDDSLATLLDSLPKEHRLPGTERIVVGPNSMPPGCEPLTATMLRLSLLNYVVAADYQPKGKDRFTLLLIPYPGSREASQAFAQLGSDLSRVRRLTDRTRSSFKFRSEGNEPVSVRVKRSQLLVTIERRDNSPAKP